MEGNCCRREGLGEDQLLEHMLASAPSPYTIGGDDGLVMIGPPSGLNLEPAAAGFVRLRHQHHQHSTRFGDNANDHHHHQLHHHTANNSTMSSSTSGISNISDSMHMRGMYPATALGQLHSQAHAYGGQSVRTTVPSPAPSLLLPRQHQPLHSLQQQTPPASAMAAGVAQPPGNGIRPRVRARRGQATDPHSIAERLRRERIAERMKALQELVPTANKTDRAAMLDEIVDYVKFLRLQVKVLSMRRLSGAGPGAIAQLVADVPLSALEGEDSIEQQVAKLMEEDIGAAMQFLQSKALCIMPVSLASAILSEPPTFIKSTQTNSHS